MDYVEFSGKNKDEAIIKASMELGTPSDELSIQVISEGSSGFLGFGSKPAIIRVRKMEPSEIEAQKQVKEIVEEKLTQPEDTKEDSGVKSKPEPEKVAEAVKLAESTTEMPESTTEPITQTKKPVREERKQTFSKSEPRKEKIESEKNEYVRRESKPVELITDENVIREITEISTKFLSDMFAAMNFPVEINAQYNTESRSLDLDLVGDDMGILIGKRGQTLDSLQYLTSLVVNKGRDSYVRIKLDTEDYRSRRKETLENLANSIAHKVRRTKRPVVLESMNPYERRIIHSTLQGNRYVETYSEGEEPYRHVVVKLKNRRNQ